MSENSRYSKPDLVFRNINITEFGNHTVNNVSGVAKNGEILGIFGPKGSGKSYLAAVLGGHTKQYNGDVLIDGNPIETATDAVAFVESQDIFLPSLTLSETLWYTALLLLPHQTNATSREKRISHVIDLMSLQTYTDMAIQFLPVSIKRYLSIACAMLVNPTALVVDHPTKGSDFQDGLKLLKILKHYAEKMDKVVVLTLSPSPSAYYQVISKALFLCSGHIAYYGQLNGLPDFLSSMDIITPIGCTPIDYLLERLSEETMDDTEPIQDKITQAMYQLRKEPEWHVKVDIEKNAIKTYRKSNGKHNNGVSENQLPTGKTRRHNESASIGEGSWRRDWTLRIKEGGTVFQSKQMVHQYHNHIAFNSRWKRVKLDVFLAEDAEHVLLHVENPEIGAATRGQERPMQYHTTFCHQFCTLLARNFHNARRRMLFPIGIIQNAYILLICVLIWWRPERNEATVKDRLGLFFFTVVQWAFFALLDAILTFPKELAVIKKERRYNQYFLFAYCLSKTISEMPLAIVQPCIYMCVMYWVANLNGFHAFLSSLVVLIVDVLAAQSIGLFVGTALRPPWTVTVVSLGLLSMMLWGGAFNTPPPWLSWGKYASYFFYGLNAFIVLEFKDAPPIQCLPNSTLPVCNMVNPMTNSTVTEFDSEMILKVQNISWSAWEYVSVLLAIMFVTRTIWYILMRRQKL